MFGKLTKDALGARDRLMAMARDKIRKRAGANTRKRLALAGKSQDDFTEDELEAILAEEESKVTNNLLKGSLIALLVFLGIN